MANVLFILGNGFDKSQGLKTSYNEFYQEFLKCKMILFLM